MCLGVLECCVCVGGGFQECQHVAACKATVAAHCSGHGLSTLLLPAGYCPQQGVAGKCLNSSQMCMAELSPCCNNAMCSGLCQSNGTCGLAATIT